MRVLGIDPGTIRMGVAVLDAQGSQYTLVASESVNLSAHLALPLRLKEIYEAVQSFIERFQPEVLSLENVFFGKDVRSLVKIGEARACAMLAAAEKKIPVMEYPPARIKQAISGNGRASKIQIQQMVRHLLHLKEMPPVDAADALAAALCHVQSERTQNLYQRFRSGDQNHVRVPIG